MDKSRGASTNVGIQRTKGAWVGEEKIAVGTTEAASGSISGYWSSLAVRIVSGAPSTLTIYAAPDDAGPFTQYWATGSVIGGAAQQVRMSGMPAGEWVEVPASVFPCGALKFVGDSAGEIEVMVRK